MTDNDVQEKQKNGLQPNQKPIDVDRWTKRKFILAFIPILFAAASIAVAIKSCRTSEDAVDIANNALNLSKKQFFQINRPRIVCTPLLFKENKKYFKFDRNQGTLKIFLKYKIENIGNVGAINIEIPGDADWFENEKLKGGIPLEEKPPGPISLAPDEEFALEIYVRGKPTGSATIESLIQNYNEGKNCITHEFPLLYHNELDTSITYSLIGEHEICADHTKILRRKRD